MTTEEFSTNNILSTRLNNDSCDPDCYTLIKTNDVNENFFTKYLGSFLVTVIVFVFVITISIGVILRRFQRSQKQKKKGKESLHVRKYLYLDENSIHIRYFSSRLINYMRIHMKKFSLLWMKLNQLNYWRLDQQQTQVDRYIYF